MKTGRRVFSRRFFVQVLVLGVLSNLMGLGYQGEPASLSWQAGPPMAQAAQAPGAPLVRAAVQYDLSPRLAALAAQLPAAPAGEAQPLQVMDRERLREDETARPEAAGAPGPDPVLQVQAAGGSMPALEFSFEGLGNVNNVLPPDPNGDIGRDYYLQWVNLSLAVWRLDRQAHTATKVLGPVPGNAVWAGFGGPCELTNDGDPIALYDHLSDRWLLSQFSVDGPFYQCLAVSQTGDPTGAWYRYAFLISETKMNDYPHLGVWPDGYYMTINQFAGESWSGTGVAAFEREKMLAGLPARMIFFDLYSVDPRYGGMLPSDLDGPPPPTGTPNFFAEADDASIIGPQDSVRIWEFHADWANPSNSTFGVGGRPDSVLPVASFNLLCPYNTNCIPQPQNRPSLDAIGDRLMHRLQYRFFGSYATLVANHSVDVGSGRAGLRWYELRQQDQAWSVHQQGTYAGPDGDLANRWLGSAAMDIAGDIALGYSVSSSQIYPSLRIAGRLASDPAGVLGQGEATLIAGGGAQTHPSGRWGDYTMLSVDPTNDCTFWYTGEYMPVEGLAPWHTRIASFTFPACLSTLTGNLEGVVTGAGASAPLAGVAVKAGSYDTQTDASGRYRFSSLPAGQYTVSAALYGYQPASVGNVTITYKKTTTQDFSLEALPRATVTGSVRDGSGENWPLYARVQISAPGYTGVTFTDPQTGLYAVNLVSGLTYSFDVQAVTGGYTPFTRSLAVSGGQGSQNQSQNFTLTVDSSSCAAPGYAPTQECQAQPGGLLVGHVLDANTSQAVNGARVAVVGGDGDAAQTFSTPEDSRVGDGFFILFSPNAGGQTFQAGAPRYGSATRSLSIDAGQILSATFSLPAGQIQIDPPALVANAALTEVVTADITLLNTGSLTATFDLSVVNAPALAPQPTGPFAPQARRVSPARLEALTAQGVYLYTPPAAQPLAAGEVIRTWPSVLAHAWGIGLDPTTDSVWVGNVAQEGGNDRLYRYTLEGEFKSQSLGFSNPGMSFPAGLAYQPFTRTFWQVSAGGDNCLFELDPSALAPTGREVCPPFSHSQRGLAFNPLDGTFFAGSWTEGVIYHFNVQGVLLDSAAVGLNIAGLAYNPGTGHLFVLNNASQGQDVYVLDTRAAYAVVGSFDVLGMDDYQQAGLALDCNGRLWLVNQTTGQVIVAESGEQEVCAYTSVPWLSAASTTGRLAPGESTQIQLTLDATQTDLGLHQAQLAINTNTPYGALTLPVTLNVLENYAFQPSSLLLHQAGAPGQTVEATLVVTNTGRFSDTYHLEFVSGQWPVKLVAGQIGPLGYGERARFLIGVTIPPDVPLESTDALRFTLRSDRQPELTRAITLVVESWMRLFMPVIR